MSDVYDDGSEEVISVVESAYEQVNSEISQRTKESAAALSACVVMFAVAEPINRSVLANGDIIIPVNLIDTALRVTAVVAGAVVSKDFAGSLLERLRIRRFRSGGLTDE